MNIQRAATMPAPHEVISIKVDFCDYWSQVCYTGTPAQLLAAGVVDAHMESKILHQGRGPMLSRDGVRFSVSERPKRLAWEIGQTLSVTFRLRIPRDALNLPGIRDIFPSGLPKEQLHSDQQREADRTHDMAARSRCVGRFQRPVQWRAIGKVITVDWAGLRRERLTAQAG